MKKYTSFAGRLSMSVVKATAVLFGLAVLIISIVALSMSKKSATKTAIATLNTAVSDIQTKMAEVETATCNMVWIVREHIDEPEYMYRITERLIEDNPDIIGSAVAFEPDFFPEMGEFYAPYSCFRDGEAYSFQMGGNDYNYFMMEWYQLPLLLGSGQWTEPYYDDGGGDQMMATFSVPVKDDEGKIIAVLTADVSLEDMRSIISGIQPYENSYTIILGRSGAFLATKDPDLLLNSTIFSYAKELKSKQITALGRQMVAGEKGVLEFWEKGSRQSFIAFGPLSNGWSVGVVSAYSDVFANTNSLMLILVLIALVGLALLYFVNRLIIKRIALPITEFTYSALNIAKGNFNARIPEVESTGDEISQLHDSLMYMEKSINSYIDELRSTTASNERFESELNIARNIQMAMLTKDFPVRDDIDIFASLSPAKEVGGDLYDFYFKDDNTLYFVIADVSGKGVPAAIFMAITRAACRFSTGLGHQVNEAMAQVNNAFADGNGGGMFVTMFLGKLDLDTREMSYCNAGHNPIVIISPDGSARFLKAKPNIAAGLFEGFPYQGESIILEKGSRIFMYTDGVTEAENPTLAQYGDDRLLAFCEGKDSQKSSQEFISELLDAVHGFTAGNSQNDDLTAMSILLK